MKGCFKGNLLQTAAFLAVFLIILLGFRLAGVRDEARIKMRLNGYEACFLRRNFFSVCWMKRSAARTGTG